MSVLKFDIRYPNGHREVAVVEGERALLGSASYCDIRFPVDQAAYEHVTVEVLGGSLRAEAKAHNPPATVNGMPLTSSPLGPDTVLGIGVVQVFVTLVSQSVDGPAAGAEGKKSKKGESSPLIRLIGLIFLPVGFYMALVDDGPRIPPPPAAVPALFASAAAKCPQSTAEQALVIANENLDVAEGKRERHPFAPGQGVAAVDLYRLSAACYRVAHAEPQAKEAEAAGKALETAVTADFRTRRIRLEHMLAVNDYELAARDVTMLQALTSGTRGPYAQWLSQLAEDLKRKVAK